MKGWKQKPGKRKADGGVADLITQTEAAKLRGVTRPAIGDLIKRGRLRSVNMFGKTLVYRSEVEGFEELKAGRPPKSRNQKPR
jgi:excisionase family DNA binding protein